MSNFTKAHKALRIKERGNDEKGKGRNVCLLLYQRDSNPSGAQQNLLNTAIPHTIQLVINITYEFRADQIQQLQQRLEACDQEFGILLSQVNDLHVQNQNQQMSTAKLKEQHRNTSQYKKLVSAQKKKKKQTPTPEKRHPHQLTVKETPAGFEPTKEAFSIHIKVLWGLIYQDSIPIPPDYSLLKEFNTQFSFSEEISNLIQSPIAVSLIPEQDVITLQGVQPGKKKLARGIINLKDFHILYVHSLLSKLGIQRWAPDLDNPSDTLYNEACRISADQTF
ncbi:hypothetical protein O181_036219 [Austropuccinia psidii MF-1]|uniref:Uncharacterized protein n=1 Tax=Austropuccinia psidii MF-1 TaxID=1389203 RepID=A0A9Q3D454_9BASI|nr:hypothetical protein [Austropuccinia psidii MF-1]